MTRCYAKKTLLPAFVFVVDRVRSEIILHHGSNGYYATKFGAAIDPPYERTAYIQEKGIVFQRQRQDVHVATRVPTFRHVQ